MPGRNLLFLTLGRRADYRRGLTVIVTCPASAETVTQGCPIAAMTRRGQQLALNLGWNAGCASIRPRWLAGQGRNPAAGPGPGRQRGAGGADPHGPILPAIRTRDALQWELWLWQLPAARAACIGLANWRASQSAGIDSFLRLIRTSG